MFDTFGLPQPTEDGMVQWFINTSPGESGASRQGQNIWLKPRGARFVSIFAIGAGGSGGTGFTRSAGSAGGGGGGGGSASISQTIWLAGMLPDALYVHAGSAESNGLSFVTTYAYPFPTPTSQNTLALSGDPASPAINGGNGTGLGGGIGGTAGLLITSTGYCLVNLALSFRAFSGQTGANGGTQTGAAGGSVAFSTGYVTAGAGGGGTTSGNFAGGNITGTASTMQVTNAGDGSNGFIFPAAISRYGGAGGSSANSATGGKGGAGATYGAGGGGGGAGTTGGSGGIGGPGLVVIQCW